MPKHRSPGRRIGQQFARIAAFSAALSALTTIVVADVIAAEPAELLAIVDLVAIDDEPVAFAAREDDGVAVLAAASVQLPDALPPPLALADELVVDPAMERPAPKKKRRRSKLKFGRFEGY